MKFDFRAHYRCESYQIKSLTTISLSYSFEKFLTQFLRVITEQSFRPKHNRILRIFRVLPTEPSVFAEVAEELIVTHFRQFSIGFTGRW